MFGPDALVCDISGKSIQRIWVKWSLSGDPSPFVWKIVIRMYHNIMFSNAPVGCVVVYLRFYFVDPFRMLSHWIHCNAKHSAADGQSTSDQGVICQSTVFVFATVESLGSNTFHVTQHDCE